MKALIFNKINHPVKKQTNVRKWTACCELSKDCIMWKLKIMEENILQVDLAI